MSNRAIVKPKSWGILNKETWANIRAALISDGYVSIWYGLYHEIPKTWAEGKVSLFLKVGKKRKLIPGRLSLESSGFDDNGDWYNLIFTCNKAIT